MRSASPRTASLTAGGSASIDRSDLLAALLSALLLNAAGPPGLAPLVLLALVPLLLRWAWRRREGTLLWSTRYGALFFGLFWGIELLWVLRLVRFGLWPLAAWVGQVAVLALLGGLFGLLLFSVRRAPIVLGAPVAWGAVEVLRGDALGPLDFPWSPLALPLTEMGALLQAGAWVGETGLGMGVVALSGLLAAGLYRRVRWLGTGAGGRDPGMKGGPWTRWGLAGLLLLGWAVAGAVRIETTPVGTVHSAVIVQPNVAMEVRRDADRALAETDAAVRALLPEALRSGPGELLLPETALPAELNDPEVARLVEGWVAEAGRPVWVGGFLADEGGRRFNAYQRWSSGGPTATWRKVELVPGVEAGPRNRAARGSSRQLPLDIGAGVVTRPPPAGVLICIESAHTHLARRHVQRGAGWLLNVTNDGWLADLPESSRTSAFRTHPAHLALRTVEAGVGAIRVGNGGWSGTVDPFGARVEAIAPLTAGIRSVRIDRIEGAPTPYLRGGWLLRPALLVAGLLLLLGTALEARRGTMGP